MYIHYNTNTSGNTYTHYKDTTPCLSYKSAQSVHFLSVRSFEQLLSVITPITHIH